MPQQEAGSETSGGSSMPQQEAAPETSGGSSMFGWFLIGLLWLVLIGGGVAALAGGIYFVYLKAKEAKTEGDGDVTPRLSGYESGGGYAPYKAHAAPPAPEQPSL